MKLPKSFYSNNDVVYISKRLIGKKLFTHINGIITGGIITETEAYCGATDKACHAYPNKKTKRTEVIFQEGGVAYVYLCYGIHHLFNIVTNEEGSADAVLIRSIEPTIGIDTMLSRRGMNKLETRLTTGPGSMSKALGIDKNHYGVDLTGNVIWIENGQYLKPSDVVSDLRIGIDYAEEDALLPWRFILKNSKWVSKKRT